MTFDDMPLTSITDLSIAMFILFVVNHADVTVVWNLFSRVVSSFFCYLLIEVFFIYERDSFLRSISQTDRCGKKNRIKLVMISFSGQSTISICEGQFGAMHREGEETNSTVK